ncbi:MAG: methyltransferase domain-containing protein [Acidimicrobiales bacterium]
MAAPASSSPGDNWDPTQYSRFASERAQPFFDLLDMVAAVPGGDVVDLGCGTGELTVALHEHSRARTTVGIDSSEAMLSRATPLAGNGLRFELGDINSLRGEDSFDVLFANASLQWVPDHPRLLRELAARLRPHGQLAVQVPANGDHPSHALADELARQPPFSECLEADTTVGAPVVCPPERYAELLNTIGFCDQQVRLQVYGHRLASVEEVIEWTKGTTLLRFKAALPPELYDLFLARYRQRLAEVLGNESPYFYTFKRILFWARLPEHQD